MNYKSANIRVRDGLESEYMTLLGSSHSDKTFPSAIQELITEGARSKMTQNSKPISRFWLDTHVSWGNVASTVLEFYDAVSRECGVVGPLDSKHRFVPVPKGCKYAEKDRQVYIVLRDGFDLGPKGETIIVREQE